MLGPKVRPALVAIAIGAAGLSTAATAPASPQGPCDDVPYVGVCTPLPGATGKPPPNAKSDPSLHIIIPSAPGGGSH